MVPSANVVTANAGSFKFEIIPLEFTCGIVVDLVERHLEAAALARQITLKWYKQTCEAVSVGDVIHRYGVQSVLNAKRFFEEREVFVFLFAAQVAAAGIEDLDVGQKV